LETHGVFHIKFPKKNHINILSYGQSFSRRVIIDNDAELVIFAYNPFVYRKWSPFVVSGRHQTDKVVEKMCHDSV
jgi:hypothetical protein